MKTKRLVLVLVLMLVASISVPGFASSNPFSDVPADHWAYDSIIQLAAVGLVEGYPDGTYGGSRMMTRYESAMVFARTLARLEALVSDEVLRSTAGVREDITADVLANIEETQRALSQLIRDELANIEIPVVEKTIVEQPIEKIVEVQPVERPFVLTPEAEALISELVGELAGEQLAAAEDLARETIIETKVIERVVVEVEEVDEELIRSIANEILAYHLQELRDENARLAAADEELADRLAALERDMMARLQAVIDGQAVLADDISAVDHRVDEIDVLLAALRGDVVGLEGALDHRTAELSQSIADLSREFESELAILGIRVNQLVRLFSQVDARVTELEAGLADTNKAVAAVDARVDDVEEDVDDLRAVVERLTLSGSLTAGIVRSWESDPAAGNIFDVDYMTGTDFVQNFDVLMTYKADDDVTVNAFMNARVDLGNFAPNRYWVEVLSETPVRRLVGGMLDGAEVSERFNSDNLMISDMKDKMLDGAEVSERFNRRILAPAPNIGALADLKLLDSDVNVLFGRNQADGLDFASAHAVYDWTPDFGVVGGYSILFESNQSALLGGIFGELSGVSYEADMMVDQRGADSDVMVEIGLETAIDAVDLDLNWAYVQADFGDGSLANSGLFSDAVAAARTKLELGASTEFLGIDFDARLYNERGGDRDISGNMITVSQELDLQVPVQLSGSLGSMSGQRQHSQLKAGISEVPLFESDILVGSSVTVARNWINGDWRNDDNWTPGRDVVVLGLDAGYGFDWSGADVDLGYDYQLAIPFGPTSGPFGFESRQRLDAGYGFAESLQVKLGVLRVDWQEPQGDSHHVNRVDASLGVKF